MKWNLAERLRQGLPPDEWALLTAIADAAAQLGLPLYVVGGLPRDLIIGKASSDFDLVVEGRAEALAYKLAHLYGGMVTVHSRFGTAKWALQDSRFEIRDREWHRQSLDLVSARSEIYKHPGALPTIQPGTIDDDLRRRDFSINALAIRLDGAHFGQLHDDLGGLDDLRQGIVRVLHEGSFVDDPTRMYRAVRYEERFEFKIARETLVLMPPARDLVDRLSPHRIRHELDLILSEPRPGEILGRLAELDLLKPIHAALFYDRGVQTRLSRSEGWMPAAVPDKPAYELRWILWLMVLPAEQIESVNQRLHLSAALLRALLAASKLQADLVQLSEAAPSRWVEILDEVPLMAVYAAGVSSRTASVRKALERYLVHWRHIKPETTGEELKKLGIEPGPLYSTILRDLRRARLDGRVNSEEQERAYLMDMLESHRTTGKPESE